jgi:E1A-binding protein p400
MFYFQSTIQDLFNIDIAENDASRRMAEVLDRDNERERRRQKDDAQVCFPFSYFCLLYIIC